MSGPAPRSAPPPARGTVNDDFWRGRQDRTPDRLHHALCLRCREQAGREASPTIGIIDGQSVKSAKKRGRSDPHGYGGGKKIKGKKRHVLVDTGGLLMHAAVHAADVQHRDGGVLLTVTLSGLYPFPLKLYANGGHAGPKFRQGLARACRHVNVAIVKRSDAGRFVVLPRRWIVERAIAWLNRCRRLARNWECLNQDALRS